MPDKQMPPPSYTNSSAPAGQHGRRGSLSNWLFGSQRTPIVPTPTISQPVPIPFPKAMAPGTSSACSSADAGSVIEFGDLEDASVSAHTAFLDRRKSTSAMHRTPTHEEERILNGELSW